MAKTLEAKLTEYCAKKGKGWAIAWRGYGTSKSVAIIAKWDCQDVHVSYNADIGKWQKC